MRVKICGITSQADAFAAVEAGADALGFVFAPGTPRCVSAEQVATMIRALPPLVAKVGLFVDAPASQVWDVISATGLDTIQLHGNESPDFCREFQGKVKVMKSFRMRSADTLLALPEYSEVADAFLLDAYVAGAPGGTGTRFDWTLAEGAKQFDRPVILAGGLTPENVAQAVRQVQPFAVDVSSGVEQAPGKKDVQKLRQFVAAAKGAGA